MTRCPSSLVEIVVIFSSRKEEVTHVATTIDNSIIAENDYNLSVNSYVQPKDTREKINIEALNKEVAITVKKIDKLRGNIDTIISEI